MRWSVAVLLLLVFSVFVLVRPAAADTAVTLHGTFLRGDLYLDGDEVVHVRGRKEMRAPRGEFLLVEKNDGTLLWTSGFAARMRGYDYIARERRRDLLVDLLQRALAARARALSRRLLDQAEADGFTGTKAEALKRKLERLEKRPGTADAKKAALVTARLPEVHAVAPVLLVQRARKAFDGGADGLRLLREALRLDPKHPDANALLAKHAPARFPIGTPRFWLDWHLDLESSGARLVPDDKSYLERARRLWRKDLYGLQAGPIRLVTPVRDTRTVGRCLAYGRLICDVLAEMFRTLNPKKRLTESLVVFLYETKEDYVNNTGTGRPIEDRAFLQTSAGHYSPLEQLSRVVWDNDRDNERRVARVFVHELTHHWINELNPRFSSVELRLGSDKPGYWIVEGLATFIQEGRYDVETGAYSLFDSRAHSLDSVRALKKAKQLLPWAAVYAADYRAFRELPRDQHTIPAVMRWHVGPRMFTRARVFYEQAAATVHFLYHGEKGRYRSRLLDYVTNHYTGKKAEVAIDVAFGMSPEELGKKVEAFADRVAAGWRPD